MMMILWGQLRAEQVPESEYKTLPNGLKYYDVKVGGGKAAEKGSRVAVSSSFLSPTQKMQTLRATNTEVFFGLQGC
jgi:hypothetical protein